MHSKANWRFRLTWFAAPLLLIAAMNTLTLAQSNTTTQQRAVTRPTLVFMSDFGIVDDSVAICKGVMYGIEPNLRLIDLTHDVKPFNVLDAGRFLSGATPYYPPGTVFVVVVDPTVGSTRKAIVARTGRGQYMVVPDNGLLTLVADQDGIDAAREITNPNWMIGAQLSSTFHGRDIFSPVGAHIAHGDDWTQVGPALDVASLVRLKVAKSSSDAKGLSATIIGTDGPFGNLVTNVSKVDFAALGYALGAKVPITIDGKSYEFPFMRTFSDVPTGSPLLYIDSRGRLALAINQGSFAQRFAVPVPSSLFIQPKTGAR
jgi:S-adenosylmethionine hydrolase